MSFSPKSIYASLPRTQRATAVVISAHKDKFLYCNGNNVFTRDLGNPAITEIYSQHSAQTTVARYAPSGFYICSADASGKVRIWDTTQAEHILKYEYPALSGAIRDLAWSPDSKRIVVVGEGREHFGRVFLWDSGSSVGEIMGHSKAINSVDYRPERPYRIATASEDFSCAFFHGPPFKYNMSMKDHTRFANCIRFSPNGEHLASVGSDCKAFIYDGKTAEKKLELGTGKGAHAGGIYSCSWSPDSTRVLTASADKTCKVWDVETNAVVKEFTLGTTVNEQQLGCLWHGDYLLSVALSGDISYLDLNSGSVSRTLTGHNKNITALRVTDDKTAFHTGAYDGGVVRWEAVDGAPSKATAEDLFVAGPHREVQGVKLEEPSGVAGKDGLKVVSCLKEVAVLRDGKKISSVAAEYGPTSISIHPEQGEVAVGGKDNKIHIYSLSGDSLSAKTEVAVKGEVTQVEYSPDGAHLAASDSGRQVGVFATGGDFKQEASWIYHASRVTCLAWAPDSQHLASGGVDTHIYVWNLNKIMDKIFIKNAHATSAVTKVDWLSDTVLISVGNDCSAHLWDITHS